ncbi:DnaJ domain-containing protein [Sphingomonas sp. KR3-1]|uniref:DnaJ domain-containing protein n=1 Tax=Sphingomonas sp. KR3-1 TaxID=3156611 RepID=UPI0032B549DC
MVEFDPYATLGVTRDAPDFVIQAAYRACLKKYHPDQYHGADARQRTADILEAYRLIGDAEARAEFDSAPSGGAYRPPPPQPVRSSAGIVEPQRFPPKWLVPAGIFVGVVVLVFWAVQRQQPSPVAPPASAVATPDELAAPEPAPAPSATPTLTALPTLDTILAFKSPVGCDMTPATKKLFTHMVRLDQTTYAASQGPAVTVPGFAAQLTPTFSRNRNAEPGMDVRDVEATLPTNGLWHGFHVSKIRYRFMEESSFWEMQIRFLEPPAKLRTALNGLGFQLPAIGEFRKFSSEDEVSAGIGVEEIPGGSALTCGSSMYY